MSISKIKVSGSWRDVADSARTTIGLDEGDKEVSEKWKRAMLLCEHSPIRQLNFKWKWLKIAYWVSVHFVRHWLGIIHYVSTSRTDRTGTDRSKLPQDNPVNHECFANAQALINISRVRLCKLASPETRAAWQEVVDAIRKVDPAMASRMVPNCCYRGGGGDGNSCPELKSCGWWATEEAKKMKAAYWSRD